MRTPRILWLIPFLIFVGLMTVCAVLLRNEMLSSRLQSEWLAYYGNFISYHMEDGPNPDMHPPMDGPYNQRLGYSYIPFFTKSLSAGNYFVAAQARTSPAYDYFIGHGLYPIYHAKTAAGLALYDRDGVQIYNAVYPEHVFRDFDSIPPLLVDTLLYIENRELLSTEPVTRNPVIEWRRFLYAAFGHVFQIFVPGFNAGGGSTLATQIEKFRYSPGGETRNAGDKLRQIASASMRVYLDGPDTTEARKKIVLDYLNSTPFSARPGYGEINSIGDALWAWFGIDLNQTITALTLSGTDPESLRVKGYYYRAALGLILAQRRPTYYLSVDHAALDNLTDATLNRLAGVGIISPALRDAAKAARFRFLAEAPAPPQPPFLEQKATNALRSHLLSMLGLRKLYELDRLDLAARTTLDQHTQRNMVDFLRRMDDRSFVEQIGLYGFRLLNPANDPAKIKWSVVLYEKGETENKIRVQADNIDAPFDMNEGMKLDLGSTAKLRTLVTYLEIIGELHGRYKDLPKADLEDLVEEAPDALSLWAAKWMAQNPGAPLNTMLAAAMDRRYSANPAETFFTGGGEHRFVNFERKEDSESYDLREAFAESVNLVFVRLMRDIVNYTIGQSPQSRQELLDDADAEGRRAYLERFADREGSVFLSRFIGDYENLTPPQIVDRLAGRGHKSAAARTILFRSVRPKDDFAAYAAFMAKQPISGGMPGEEKLRKLYADYPVERYSLADRAYILGVNPLELWLAAYKQDHPQATRSAILRESRPVRIESYAWLFHPRLKHAQDTRIRVMLEADAFARIQKRWARLGYPFERLVPSLATSIGSSADRPGALAELVGIILNEGARKPAVRFESLQFGAGTPYQTLLIHNGDRKNEQVLDPAVARTVKEAMTGVVSTGTAKRVNGAYADANGLPYLIGGKTGTGDHRYDEFGAGGRLISSRVMNRTGTFVFFIGDKYFGAITAHVAGDDAADYKFTSALSAQMLKALAPVLQPLINNTPATAQQIVSTQNPP